MMPQELYQFKVLPSRMKNAPATFQKFMNRVNRGLSQCVMCIDDLVVFIQSWEEHLHHRKELFDLLEKANLMINLAKNEFAKAHWRYTGPYSEGHRM